MTAIMRTTSRQKKNSKNGKDRFDYKMLQENINLYKTLYRLTYFELAKRSGISMGTIVAICKGKYNSDLSIGNVCILCEMIDDDLCNYIKQ